MKKAISILLINILIIGAMTTINNISYASTRGSVDDLNQDNYQGIESQIDQLKQDHPNWQFEILYTGLDWNTVIQNETGGGKNVIHSEYTGTQWTDGTTYAGWCGATKTAISYIMDPRYFLNENDVFQFADISYSGYDRQQLLNMTSGTFLYNNSYIDALIKYGEQYNVSPYFLVAKIIQEQGANPTSPLGTGESYTYNGVTYSGIYNLFNIRATGSTTESTIANGLAYAQTKGWTSIELSIEGGASFLHDNYIARNQTSTYLQKFDVEDSDGTIYSHQYMTNLFGAQAEGWNLKNTYQKYGGFDNSFKFVIPVYNNMPTLTQGIDLAKINCSTLSLKDKQDVNSTRISFAYSGNTVTRIAKAANKNSSDGYYWDLVILSNGMIGYMARGASDDSKEYLVSYKEMSINPVENVTITEDYSTDENLVTINAYSSKGFTKNKDASWKLSSDGKTYSKEYTDNTDYYTTFTLSNGVNVSKEIKVTKIDPNGIKITKEYNEEKNTENISVYDPQGFTANKEASWKLSSDGKTYSKEYIDNTDYYTTFTFKDGTTKNTRIRIENIDNNKVGITKEYNPDTNLVTIHAYNNDGFTANKDSSWVLSTDKKTYTKEYNTNSDYYESFTLTNGTNTSTKISFSSIEDNKITLSVKYKAETNTETVYAYCSQEFTANKDVSWVISSDGRTYSKEYNANTNYYTTFTLKNGTKKQGNIVVTDIQNIDTNIVLTPKYNAEKNITTISAYNSTGFTANKDASWTLSSDGKTYSKEYSKNVNESEKFTLKSGYIKQENMVVTNIVDTSTTLTQKYDAEKNTVIVSTYCSQGFTANKDASWTLSSDGKTYSKEYKLNANINETFTLKSGYVKQESIVVSSIDYNKITLTQKYDEAKNVTTIYAYCPQGFTTNKDASWVISSDGRTYSKEYNANTNYYTTFTLKDGTQKQENILVTSISNIDTNIALTQKYNVTTNTVTVSAYNSIGFTANKDASWTLSSDGKTYTREYSSNVNENETFTLKNGTQKQENIVVTSIIDTNINMTQKYNASINTVTVSAYNSTGFTASKDASWTLSSDGKTYSKEYSLNANENETFTLKSGFVEQINIVVTSVIDSNITLSTKYNPETNVAIVIAYCSQGFTGNKDVSWKLSSDGKTYSKEYTANTNYYTTFTLKDGTKKQGNIVVTSIIDTNIDLTQKYNAETNTTIVSAYNSTGFTANKDASWTLSSDGKTYSKGYTLNANENETFTLKSGFVKNINIVVTSFNTSDITLSTKYNPETNVSTVVAYCSQGFTGNKDVSWKLSEDGKTYSKEYTANTNYYTTFTLKDGTKKQGNIVVTSIIDTNINMTQKYNVTTNTVKVSAYNPTGFTANKDANWTLSSDGKTYSKEYTSNINENETFTLKSGYAKQINIVVTSVAVINNEVTLTQDYNQDENSVTINAYNAQGFIANKDVSWKLSEDGKTYSKKYNANTDYTTTFTLNNGTKVPSNIKITSIDVNKVSIYQTYDETKNLVTIYAYNPQGFIANKDVSWKLSEDGKTYQKEYTANTNYTTTFTLKPGTKLPTKILITDIK